MSDKTPLFLKARSIEGNRIIVEALNKVPNISKQVRGIGWSLAIEQAHDVSFYEDTLAYACADGFAQGRKMLLNFAALLDRNVGSIDGMDECLLQAWVVGEKMDVPVRHLNIHWSRHRATNPKVVSMLGPGRRVSV